MVSFGALKRDPPQHPAPKLVEQDAGHALGIDLTAAQQKTAPPARLLKQVVAQGIAFLP